MELCEKQVVSTKSRQQQVEDWELLLQDWVIRARARWLATRVAWVSSAVSVPGCPRATEQAMKARKCSWTVWTGRAVGKARFRILSRFVTAGAENV